MEGARAPAEEVIVAGATRPERLAVAPAVVGTGGSSARRPLSRGQRVIVAVAIVVMNAVDVITTHMLLAEGATEVNPIAGRLLDAGALTPVKIGLSAGVGLLVLVAPLRRRTERVLWGVLIFYATLLTLHLAQLAGVRFA